jgi:hypothetical protein
MTGHGSWWQKAGKITNPEKLSCMKSKLSGVLIILTALISVSLNAQNLPGTGSTGPNKSSCEIRCVFGSCKANCENVAGGGAVCLCIYGFPQCGCGGGGNTTQSPEQSDNLEKFIGVLLPFGTPESKKVTDDINQWESLVAKSPSDPGIVPAVKKIVDDLKLLNSPEKTAANNFFARYGIAERL